MIASLIVILCAPGLATTCADYPTGITMPATACRGIQGKIAGLNWLLDRPQFDSHTVRGYRCDPA